MSDYDLAVVGSGPGGGTVAAHAAEAGLSVVLLERGRNLSPITAPQDHLHNTMAFRYRNATMDVAGADIRVVERETETGKVEPPHPLHMTSAYNVGGGALTWGMQAWRFHPTDFRMASHYGVPDGSSLADWPISYEDLAPYYSLAEAELGVAGEGSDTHGLSGSYPMAPFPRSEVDDWLCAGATRRGWGTHRVPLAINTQWFRGHAACVRCNQCIGFACPVNAKNGTHNTMVPRALRTGTCELIANARAINITTNTQGKVTGVRILKRRGDEYDHETVTARAVVVAAGAIETARLLLLSSSAEHPNGLGNHSGHLGRHLQSHTYPVAMGLLPPDVAPVSQGPGVGVATLDPVHDNPGVIGGALMANDFVKTPIAFWGGALPPGTPRWGAENKRAMRETFGRIVDIRGPVHEIPSPDLRVQLDPTVRDSAGVPAVRLSGQLHPETLRTAAFISEQAQAWLTESGAAQVWSGDPATASYHQAGTARMSTDPADGVTDPSGRVHGHDNLFVADSSVHVTNGSLNPALTIFALAIRTAQSIVAALA